MDEFVFASLDADKVLQEVIEKYRFQMTMRIRLLKYSENLTYLLYDDVTGEKYVLRVFRPGYHEDSELEGEQVWIHRITEDTDVKTPCVYRDCEGNFVSNINIDGVPLHCAMYAYVDGESLNSLSEEQKYAYLEKIGEMMAKLHLQAMNWQDSRNIRRFRWDLEDLIGENARWGKYTLMKGLPEAYMDTYRVAADLIWQRLEKFGRANDRYGLIHDDISINNVLLKNGELYLLDFDDCGWGWYLYDIPTAVLEDFGEPMQMGLDAVLRGYERYRPLSPEEKRELDTFNVLKKIVRIGWIATRSDNDTVKKVKPDYYRQTAALAREYIEQYSEKNT